MDALPGPHGPASPPGPFFAAPQDGGGIAKVVVIRRRAGRRTGLRGRTGWLKKKGYVRSPCWRSARRSAEGCQDLSCKGLVPLSSMRRVPRPPRARRSLTSENITVHTSVELGTAGAQQGRLPFRLVRPRTPSTLADVPPAVNVWRACPTGAMTKGGRQARIGLGQGARAGPSRGWSAERCVRRLPDRGQSTSSGRSTSA